MAAAALVADYDAKLAALRASVPNRLKEIDGVLARHFGASLDEVANKARSSPAANPELALSLSVVRETLMATAADLELGTTWLKLHVPKIQDGGNYGVVRACVWVGGYSVPANRPMHKAVMLQHPT